MRFRLWWQVSCLAIWLFGPLSSEAAKLRLYNPRCAEDANVYAAAFLMTGGGQVLDSVQFLNPGQEVVFDLPEIPDQATSVYYGFGPGITYWWDCSYQQSFDQDEYQELTALGTVPTIYLLAYNDSMKFYGRVRLWNQSPDVQTVEIGNGNFVTVQPGEVVLYERNVCDYQYYNYMEWSNGNAAVPYAAISEPGMNNLLWAVEPHESYAVYKWDSFGNYGYCKSVFNVIGPEGEIVNTIEFGPCEGQELPPDGEGGQGGGGGEEEGGGGEEEGGGGLSGPEMEQLVQLAIEEKALLQEILACCMSKGIKLEELISVNTAGFNELKELLTQEIDEQGLGAKAAAVVGGVDQGALENAQNGFGDEVKGILDWGFHPINAPPADAMAIKWQDGNTERAISLDFRDLPFGAEIAAWTKNICLMAMIIMWVWAVYKECVQSLASIWETSQAGTSGESIVGTNANIVTAGINAAVILAAIAAFLISSALIFTAVPYINEVAGFGDLNSSVGAMQLVLWTASEFIPWAIGLSLLSTYFLVVITKDIQANVARAAVKLAIA